MPPSSSPAWPRDGATAEAMRAALRAALPATIKLTDQIQVQGAAAPAAATAPSRRRRDRSPTRQGSRSRPLRQPKIATLPADAPPPSRVQPLPSPRPAAGGGSQPRTGEPAPVVEGQGLRGPSWRSLLQAPARSCSSSPAPSSTAPASRPSTSSPRRSSPARACASRSTATPAPRAAPRSISSSRCGAPNRWWPIWSRRASMRRSSSRSGYGATQPVAPNDSSENMAKNRRIEFTVRPK